MQGKWGCLGAVVMGGVGLVLTSLGFDAHTTEALPFGVVTFVVGLFVGVPSLRALRTTLADSDGAAEVESTGSATKSPPAFVRCGHCGSPAPLRLSTPSHVTCAHCGTRAALEPSLARQLASAAERVKQRTDAERKVGALLASLPTKHRALRARLVATAVALGLTALGAAAWGWLHRFTDDDWHGYAAFGLVSAPVALGLGLVLAALVPRIARAVVGHWAARELPGVPGLSCRVCGGPLPGRAAPVLRCEYCASDNLAGPEVQALVARNAEAAARGMLAVEQRSARADELSAFSLVVFPVLTLVAWFAVGAVAGGVGLRALSEVELPPADVRFAVVQTDGGACLAAVVERADDVTLHFAYGVQQVVRREAWAARAVEPDVRAAWLVGKRLAGKRVARVFSLLRTPGRVYAADDAGGLLYLPGPEGAGESLCFDAS